MRPGEYWEAISMWSQDTGADRRHIGELVRGAAFNLWNLQVDKKYRFQDPAKWWPMPWDKKKTDDVGKRLDNMTDEERDEAARRFLENTGWKP